MTMEVTSFTGPMGRNDSVSGKGGVEEEGSTRNNTLQEIDAPSLPLSSDLENHHAPDSETPPLGDMSHVSSSSSQDDGRVVIPQVQHHSETVATTTAGVDATTFSLRPQDYGLPGIIFFPDRPKHPTAFHTFISILLYPTIFEDLYGKALKTDVLGVTQVMAGVASSWETNMTTIIKCIFSVLVFHILFWMKGIQLGRSAWNCTYLSLASASTGLVLIIKLSKKASDPTFYLGTWDFERFALFSFLAILPDVLVWVTLFSEMYLIWKVDPWLVLEVILGALGGGY